MTTIYQELALRIRGEVPELERVANRAQNAWLHASRASDDQDIYLDSVALNIHSFYSGLERLFQLIARYVDCSSPESETWHRDLLYQISRNFLKIRPAVINEDNAKTLDEFRRFRHLIRNVYTTNLVPEKMTGLISVLPELCTRVNAELLAFASFLEELDRVTK
ncbi:conserved hypothetical protein [uncultured Desulfobacterium sp.]|uniref:HepT-like domain-containing protein n=1 Tax=uncultured Desulfobacterium sp. TaxID=201089 RepID=A0A445MYJ0_9BACT|nr:conserved hypothetical protein [uncultured Desulfobacterium sp.]